MTNIDPRLVALSEQVEALEMEATGGLSVSLNRVSDLKSRSGAGTVTSELFTVTVDGGSGNYDYRWTQQFGDTLDAITAPTSASTAFRHDLLVGETKTALIALAVIDIDTGAMLQRSVRFTGTETA